MRGRIRPYLLILAIPLFFLGCAGDNGDSGTLKVYVTDAKPVLPSGTEQVLITFEEVMVHKAGGDWVSLPLVQSPYTINLLQFSGGATGCGIGAGAGWEWDSSGSDFFHMMHAPF